MIYVIVGPTASGKSTLAIELAKRFNGIVVNGDAFQVYKGMDVGTAKPTKEELSEVPHLLFDIFEPTYEFSIFEYQKLLRKTLKENEDKNIFVVGGSGLYLKSAFYDFTLEENSSYDMKEYEEKSDDELYELLKSVDEEACNKIHKNNRKRVLRALEIYFSTGKKKSDIEKAQKHEPVFDVLFLGKHIPRDILYDKINARVNQMIYLGLFEEVEELMNKYPHDLKSFQAIGYKEIISGYKENKSKEEIIEEIKKSTRHYAKRQLTYFNHQLDVKWINSLDEAIALVEELKK